MPNDLMMRMKDQVLIVLADYQTCKLDTDAFLESDIGRTARDIAKRVVDNYSILSGRRTRWASSPSRSTRPWSMPVWGLTFNMTCAWRSWGGGDECTYSRFKVYS